MLNTANNIYVPAKTELNPEFSAIAKDVFNSEVKNVNFTKNKETAKEINTWVNNQPSSKQCLKKDFCLLTIDTDFKIPLLHR